MYENNMYQHFNMANVVVFYWCQTRNCPQKAQTYGKQNRNELLKEKNTKGQLEAKSFSNIG